MLNAVDLDPVSVNRLFSAETGHVPVRLNRLERPRLLWLNRRMMRRDPQFGAMPDERAYTQHLLRSCSFEIAEENEATTVSDVGIVAIADRYGGMGIGRNGGSGRAVYVNGYHVKGVGRTPLISALTDRAHASGGAYLEECVREAVFSELAGAEFPFGAVPVLAIIETGAVQIWDTDHGPKPERRCLLVRPAFIRPAHFVRAADFISISPTEGALDAQRVARTAEAACEHFGRETFGACWRAFWARWAEQLAYAYVHRLNHGGNTESNIALDGSLLDFGATTALPSWARITTTQGGPPAGLDLLFLVQACQAVAPFLGRYVDEKMGSPQALGALLAQAQGRYRETVMREVLRTLGLTRLQSAQLMQSALSGQLVAAVNRLITYFAREQFTIFDGMPNPRLPWDLERFWCSQQPEHLREMRTLLEAAIARRLLGEAPAEGVLQCMAARSLMRTRTRDGLFRDHIKRELYASLDGSFAGDDLTSQQVCQVIDRCVLRHRRDSPVEPEDSSPMGFARGRDAAYALFIDRVSGQPFAVQEWHADEQAFRNASSTTFQRLDDDRIVFADGSMASAAWLSDMPESTEAAAG
jgi:hypothetical protein